MTSVGRTTYRALLLAGVAAVSMTSLARAAGTPFDLTTTNNATQTLSSGQTGTVEPGASIVTAGNGVTWDPTSTAGTATLNNSGTINGTARGIDDNSTATSAQSFTVNNLTSSSLITSVADAFRVNKDILGGTITVNNAGTMQSTGAQQVLDFAAITSAATIKITNATGALMTTAGNSAIELGGSTFSITNNGTIQATGAAFRGINYKPANLTNLTSYTLVNGSASNSTALIASTDDAVRISATGLTGANLTTAYTVSVDNFGTIKTTGSGSGQAFDFNDLVSSGGKVTITNEATGVISAADADAMRPGTNAVVNNYGKITSGFLSSANGNASGNDAIDFQSDAGGVVNNFAGGTITGAKNGITAKYAPSIINAGTITGLDGSGINIDTSRDATPANPDITATGTVTIVNTGTIIGNAVSADGDAIDVDYLTNITNSGTIKAVGIVAPAVGSLNEALAIGGGTVVNQVGGLIISDQRAITVDDSNKGNAFGAISIDNAGTITGLNGSAIAITSILSNTLTNRATGVINGSVAMGSGNDTVNLYAGETLNGALDGGAGTDTLNLLGSGTGSLGNVSNIETLAVQGGTWTLSGSQSYSTVTIASGATLNVASGATIAGATTAAGTVTGTGTIGALTVSSGGKLVPGSATSTGTLTVNGNLALASGSTTQVTVTPTAASLVSVTGTASVNGAFVASLGSGTYTPGQQLTVLTATGGVSGAFASLSTASASYLKPRLAYDATHVYLSLDQVTLSSLAGTGVTGNQAQVLGALDKAVANGFVPTGGFLALYGLTGPALQSALDQVSGQAAPNVSGAVGQSFLGFLGMTGAGGGGATGGSYAPGSAYDGADAPHRAQLSAGTTRVWGGAYGGHVGISGDATSGAAGLSSNNVGFVGGADLQTDAGVLAGVTFSIGRQTFRSGNTTGTSGDEMIGVYARDDFGPAYVSASAGYGWHQIKTLRLVTVSGTDMLQGQQNADDYGGRIEAGWRVSLDDHGSSLAPYGAFAAERFESPAYAEVATTGANTFALAYGAHGSTLSRSEFGMRLGKSADMGDATVNADLHAAWAHQYDDQALVQASFLALGNASFQVAGVHAATDSALVGGGLEIQNTNGLYMALHGEAQLATGTTVVEGMGNLGWRW